MAREGSNAHNNMPYVFSKTEKTVRDCVPLKKALSLFTMILSKESYHSLKRKEAFNSSTKSLYSYVTKFFLSGSLDPSKIQISFQLVLSWKV